MLKQNLYYLNSKPIKKENLPNNARLIGESIQTYNTKNKKKINLYEKYFEKTDSELLV